MSGEPRTSKAVILGRFGIYGWSFGVTAFYIASALGLAVTIGPFIIGAVLGVGLLVLFLWGSVRVIGYLLFGGQPEYQQFIQNGGDPYLDFVPPPFNSDTQIQRLGGLREPEYTAFVPPSHWRCQCPCCGARVESSVDVCWHCGYGEDIVQCPNCHQFVKELTPGDFQNSVICCHCSHTFQPF